MGSSHTIFQRTLRRKSAVREYTKTRARSVETKPFWAAPTQTQNEKTSLNRENQRTSSQICCRMAVWLKHSSTLGCRPKERHKLRFVYTLPGAAHQSAIGLRRCIWSSTLRPVRGLGSDREPKKAGQSRCNAVSRASSTVVSPGDSRDRGKLHCLLSSEPRGGEPRAWDGVG